MDDICHLKCTFGKCVDELNSVITKGSLHQIKEYVRTHCESALTRFDSDGRLPLHVAASCGKADIVRWLCEIYANSGSNAHIDSKDLESGWTALHRAVYYGRIPSIMVLLQHGASVWLKDKSGCNILDMMMRDTSPWLQEPLLKINSSMSVQRWSQLRKSDPTEVYTWGINENMTLAQGNQKSRKFPEVVEFFARKHISIKQVIMCKFHAVFLAHNGNVFSCGTGRGGRLGIGRNDVFIDPQRIDFGNSMVVMIAASTDHTVFVTEDGQLFTCGLNHFRTLGIHPPPERNDFPARVVSLRDHVIIGCCAGLCHTVAWTNNALFTFGTNTGQMGHAKRDLVIVLPRRVSSIHRENDKIVNVHACDTATVVYTRQGTVYLLHNYACRKILTKHLDIIKVQVGGGRLGNSMLAQVKSPRHPASTLNNRDKKQESQQRDIKVLILKKSGDMLSWSGEHATTDHCIFDEKQLRWISDLAISNNGAVVLLVAADGTAYLGHFSSWQAGRRKASSSHKQGFATRLDLVELDSVQKFRLEQLPCAFRSHTGALAPKGRNAALLQSDPRNFITQVPVVDAEGLEKDIQNLWRDTDVDDILHDITLRVKRKDKADVIFAAHRFVLATRSPYLGKLMLSRSKLNSSENIFYDQSPLHRGGRKVPQLVIENVYPEVLRNCLEYLYCGQCEMLQNGQNVMVQFPNLGKIRFYWEDKEENSAMPEAINDFQHDKHTGTKRKPNQNTDVLSLLKDLAVRLEIRELNCKYFENLTIVNNNLVVSKGQCSTRQNILTPTVCPALYDCCVECDDLITFNAHKCVLSARVPFFRGMLLSPWLETLGDGAIAQLRVPVPSDIFRYVLDFAYTDSESSLQGANTLESLCEVLAAADLLLMDKLKQIAEVQIVPLLGLKNLISVIEVAVAFNSKQLYDSCLQFAFQHLPALIQTPSFYSMNEDSLEKLENVYRSSLSNAYMRSMPPYLSGPNIDHIPEYNEAVFQSNSDDVSRQQATSPKRRSINQSSQTSRRKSSSKKQLGIMISDLLGKSTKEVDVEIVERIIASVDEKLTDISKISTAVTTPTTVMKPNKEEVANKSKILEQPTLRQLNEQKLEQNIPNSVKDSHPTPMPVKQKQEGSVSKYNALFPQLGSSDGITSTLPHQFNPLEPIKSTQAINTSKPNNIDSSIAINGSSGAIQGQPRKKLSQKEKRRLREEEEKKKNAQPAIIDRKPTISNAWGIPFSDKDQTGNSCLKPLSPLNETSFQPKSPSTFTSSPITNDKTTGPWQHRPTAHSKSPVIQDKHQINTPPASNPTSFLEIVQSEEASRERAEKISKKPLALIQMEDQAMAELNIFYEKKLNPGSQHFVTVARVSDQTAREIALNRKLTARV